MGPRDVPLAACSAAPLLFAALLLIATLAVSSADTKLRVVASLTDLGSIAAAVGGDEVEVAAIARPNVDPHRVEVLPSYMVRVSRADVYLQVGFGLDPWAAQIIDGSHNSGLQVVDCSKGIAPLEKPTGRVDGSMGDVHPDGNPHYWLDPANAGHVAATVAEALAREAPEHAAEFRSRAAEFARRCDALRLEGRARVGAVPNRQFLSYHRSWVYLADAFGFEVAATVEPVPGIPPTAKHLHDLVVLIEEGRVPTLLSEPYFSGEAGEFLARETGISVHQVAPSCDDVSADSYLTHIRRIVELLVTGAGQGG